MVEGGLTVQRGTQHPSSRGDEAGAEIERDLTKRIVKADEAAAEIVTDTTDIGGVEMTRSGLTGDIDQVHATETDITGKDQDQETLTGKGTASEFMDRGETAAIRLSQDDRIDHGRDREIETTTGGIDILEQGTVGEAQYGHNKSRA